MKKNLELEKNINGAEKDIYLKVYEKTKNIELNNYEKNVINKLFKENFLLDVSNKGFLWIPIVINTFLKAIEYSTEKNLIANIDLLLKYLEYEPLFYNKYLDFSHINNKADFDIYVSSLKIAFDNIREESSVIKIVDFIKYAYDNVNRDSVIVDAMNKYYYLSYASLKKEVLDFELSLMKNSSKVFYKNEIKEFMLSGKEKILNLLCEVVSNKIFLYFISKKNDLNLNQVVTVMFFISNLNFYFDKKCNKTKLIDKLVSDKGINFIITDRCYNSDIVDENIYKYLYNNKNIYSNYLNKMIFHTVPL